MKKKKDQFYGIQPGFATIFKKKMKKKKQRQDEDALSLLIVTLYQTAIHLRINESRIRISMHQRIDL